MSRILKLFSLGERKVSTVWGEAIPFIPSCDSGGCFYINIQRNKATEERGTASQHPSIHPGRKQEARSLEMPVRLGMG